MLLLLLLLLSGHLSHPLLLLLLLLKHLLLAHPFLLLLLLLEELLLLLLAHVFCLMNRTPVRWRVYIEVSKEWAYLHLGLLLVRVECGELGLDGELRLELLLLLWRRIEEWEGVVAHGRRPWHDLINLLD